MVSGSWNKYCKQGEFKWEVQLFPLGGSLVLLSQLHSSTVLAFFHLKVAEEEYLIQELRKIEARKKEREKRTQDLQKLITAADTTTEQRRAERKAPKKKLPQKKETEKPVNILCFFPLPHYPLLWHYLQFAYQDLGVGGWEW